MIKFKKVREFESFNTLSSPMHHVLQSVRRAFDFGQVATRKIDETEELETSINRYPHPGAIQTQTQMQTRMRLDHI